MRSGRSLSAGEHRTRRDRTPRMVPAYLLRAPHTTFRFAVWAATARHCYSLQSCALQIIVKGNRDLLFEAQPTPRDGTAPCWQSARPVAHSLPPPP